MRYKIRDARYENGSALILAVVLTSLLAIVGVLFVMTARVDKIATSAISEHRELDLAIDAVIARIAQELVLDVPDPCRLNEEYYDYPDDRNAWLASLEPYESDRWLHISALYYIIGHQPYVSIANLDADAYGDGVSDSIWVELPNITSGKGWPIFAAIRVIDNGAMLNVNTAYKFDDAEGLERIDGSSLMQINLMALASQPGETLPAWVHERDLHNARANYSVPALQPADLDAYYLRAYEENVVWRYTEPNGLYTPFDISDELELRYRFLLNHPDIDTRLEQLGAPDRTWGFREYAFMTPVEAGDLDEWFISACGGAGLDPNYSYRHIATTYNMDRIIAPDGGKMANVNIADKYALRNRITAAFLYAGRDVDTAKAEGAQIAANLIDFRDDDDIVTDVCDVDGLPYYGFERPCVYISELVHNYVSDVNSTGRSYAIELYKPYFEDNIPDPCGWRLVIDGKPIPIEWEKKGTEQFYVELFEDPNALLSLPWRDSTDTNGPSPADEALWVDPNVVLGWPVAAQAASYDIYFGTNFADVNDADSSWPVGTPDDSNVYKGNLPVDNNSYGPFNLELGTMYYWRIDDVTGNTPEKRAIWSFRTATPSPSWWSPGDILFGPASIIELRRFAQNGVPVVVDSIQVPDWLVAGAGIHSFQRDITPHKCIRHLWDRSLSSMGSTTLGYSNVFEHPDPNMIQAHPENIDFVGIGDIGKVFRRPAYYEVGPRPLGVIGYSSDANSEEEVRIDLANPNYQRIFNYLTVFDPSADGINNDGDVNSTGSEIIDENDLDGDGYPEPGDELKIPGRININTAPWYVIAQLPWMTPEIAQAIVYYRRGPQGPFESIGELNNVVDVAAPLNSIDYYGRADGPAMGDEIKFPDLTPQDEAADDFEERDLLFARISNLVTVRSDVFTAYILVRIGPDGPQKRVIAILDRSDVYADGTGGVTGRVRVRALHPVPDPR